MKPILYLFACTPLLLGASMPPAPAIAPSGRTNAVEVNFVDRFMRDVGVRKQSSKPSERRRQTRPARTRAPIPPAPAVATVPVPTPKPGTDATATNPTPASEAPVAQPPENKLPETQAPAAQVPTAQPPVADKPAPQTVQQPPEAADIPKPTPKPAEPAAEKPPAETTAEKPEGGKPEADKPGAEKAEDAKPEADQKQQQADALPPPPPLEEEDPKELKACLADLKALGAKFEATDAIDEGNGCGIKQPIDVAEVLPGVELGGATMRCQTALTMAHWLKDTVQPAMNIAMPGRKITGIVPGSTYQCRLRNSATTGKISEHARGNAFDVAAFKLDNGDKVEMKPRDDDHTLEGAFQKTATAGACLHFTTVLAPGSDAAHENHLHVDIIERNGGYRICE